MRRSLFLPLIILFCAFTAQAQESPALHLSNSTGTTVSTTTTALPSSRDALKKFEIYVGYSFAKVKFDQYKNNLLLNAPPLGNTFKKREAFNGFEVAGVYNFSRYVGVKGDFSIHFNRGGRSGRRNNTNLGFSAQTHEKYQ